MKKFINWIPAIFLMIVIFVLSSQPGDVVNSTVARTEPVQKVGHLILFALLCLSYYKATKKISFSIILTFLYALIDEAHQSFTLGRSPGTDDIFVDMIGASISSFLIWKKLPNLPEKLKSLLLK